MLRIEQEAAAEKELFEAEERRKQDEAAAKAEAESNRLKWEAEARAAEEAKRLQDEADARAAEQLKQDEIAAEQRKFEELRLIEEAEAAAAQAKEAAEMLEREKIDAEELARLAQEQEQTV